MRTEEATISGLKPASWAYAEEYVAEDEVLANARARAQEVGVTPIGTGAGAALRFLAAVTEARAVVEIGTGTGVPPPTTPLPSRVVTRRSAPARSESANWFRRRPGARPEPV